MILTSHERKITKGNGSAEVGEIVVVSLCFALCRPVITAATAVVVYVTLQAMFGDMQAMFGDDKAGLILISRFLPFPYEKFAYELLHSYPPKFVTPPLVPSRLSFWDERATAEVKISTSETKQASSFIFFYLEN